MILHIDVCQAPFLIENTLSTGEKNKANAFHFKHLQRNYIFSHSFKRFILSTRFPICREEDWRFSTLQSGKPFVDLKATRFSKLVPTQISFNLSHSNDCVAIGSLASDYNSIGIDVELYKSTKDLEGVQDIAFHIEEKNCLLACQNQDESFFKLWTAKEAVLKAAGHGLVDGITQLNCSQSLKTDQCYLVMWHDKEYCIQTFSFGWGVISVSWLSSVEVSLIELTDWKSGKPYPLITG